MFLTENYRHSIMYAGQQCVCGGCQYRARLNRCAVRICPLIPKSGESKQGIVLHSEVEGLLLFSSSRPFEKAVGRQQAPAAHEGISKGGLTRHCFRSGIDRLESDAGVRGPGRNEAPASQREMPLRPGSILTNDSDRLRRGDVVEAVTKLAGESSKSLGENWKQ